MADNYRVGITLEASDKTGPAVGSVNRNMDTVKAKAEETGGAFDRVGGEIEGAFAGASIAAAIGMVGQLGEAGREAHIAEDAFRSLAGGLGDAQANMDGLVGAGQGLIDDTDLYREGAKLLSSQAVTTSTDMESLVKSGVILGSTFAGSASAGVDALGTAIEGMNYRGLKALGISIPAVKDRVKELTDAGLGLQDAFRQAALEQAAMAAEKLGGVAYSATTRLNIALGDIKDTLGEIVAGGIEAGAQLAQLPGMLLQKAKNEAATKQTADEAGFGRGTVAAQTIDQTFKDTLGADFVSKFMIEVLTNVNENPGVANQAKLTGEQMAEFVAQGWAELDPNTAQNINDMLFGGNNEAAARGTAQQYIQGLVQYAFDQNREFIAVQQTADQRRRAGATAYAATASTYGGFAPQTSDLSSVVMGGMTAAEQQLNGLIGQAKTLGGVVYLTPEQHDLAAQMTESFRQSYDYASKLHDQGIIADDAFAPLKDANTEMQGLVDKSKAYSANLDTVMGDLDKIAGVGAQGPGDQLSQQIEDRVVAAMKARGMSDSDISKYQASTDLTNGRNTPLNQTINDQVIGAIAQITQQNGATAGAMATERAQTALDQLVQKGASPAEIEAAIKSGVVTGFKEASPGSGSGGGGSKLTVKPGDGLWSIAQRTGMSYDEIRRLTGGGTLQPGEYGGGGGFVPAGGGMVGPDQGGFSQGGDWLGTMTNMLSGGSGGSTGAPIDFSQMATQTGAITQNVLSARDAWLTINGYVDTTAQNTSAMAQNAAPALASSFGDSATAMDKTQVAAQKTSDLITGLTSKKQVINVQINATNPDGMLTFILSKQSINKIINDNAGVLPGADNRR